MKPSSSSVELEIVKIKGPVFRAIVFKRSEVVLGLILDEGEERLVIEVRSQTIIYHQSHPSERVNIKKQMSWKAISGAGKMKGYSL